MAKASQETLQLVAQCKTAQAEELAAKRQYERCFQILRERVIQGKTTGNHALDLAIMFEYSLDSAIGGTYLPTETRFRENAGGPVLIIHKETYREGEPGCFGGAFTRNDYSIWAGAISAKPKPVFCILPNKSFANISIAHVAINRVCAISDVQSGESVVRESTVGYFPISMFGECTTLIRFLGLDSGKLESAVRKLLRMHDTGTPTMQLVIGVQEVGAFLKDFPKKIEWQLREHGDGIRRALHALGFSGKFDAAGQGVLSLPTTK